MTMIRPRLTKGASNPKCQVYLNKCTFINYKCRWKFQIHVNMFTNKIVTNIKILYDIPFVTDTFEYSTGSVKIKSSWSCQFLIEISSLRSNFIYNKAIFMHTQDRHLSYFIRAFKRLLFGKKATK